MIQLAVVGPETRQRVRIVTIPRGTEARDQILQLVHRHAIEQAARLPRPRLSEIGQLVTQLNSMLFVNR